MTDRSGFTFTYFERILKALKASFRQYLLRDMLEIKRPPRSGYILRHDVDIDLQTALLMARIEQRAGVRSTYMVIPDWPLYSLDDSGNQNALREMVDMGHEIGLHFNLEAGYRHREGCSLENILEKIAASCERLALITGTSINSVSFHRPLPWVIGGELTIRGRVNAYARDLMRWYLSDSKGRWKGCDPLLGLKNPKAPLLQILIHPIWWGERRLAPEDRLEEFFQTATAGMTPEETTKFDEYLAAAISIRRRKCRNQLNKR